MRLSSSSSERDTPQPSLHRGHQLSTGHQHEATLALKVPLSKLLNPPRTRVDSDDIIQIFLGQIALTLMSHNH